MPEIREQTNQPSMSGDPVRTKRIIILGSTGSIGTQTIEAVAHLNQQCDRGQFPHRFEIVGLAGGSNARELLQQADAWGVADLALADDSYLDAPHDGLRIGDDAAEHLVRDVECDLVVGAIVGIAGLRSVLAAVERGTDVALANKESLVAGGSLVVPVAQRTGARLLPIDSEHAGVWQCLASAAGIDYAPPAQPPTDIARVTLTASGGAFRDQNAAEVADANADMALAHPTWSMGAKVTVDTATLINKGFELIEAHWLFGIEADRLDAVIHPTSTVHALLEMGDGTVVAQLGAPDMRTPIMRAIAFPERSPRALTRLNPASMGTLQFREIPDDWRPGIDLALNAIRSGGTAGAVLNGANEAAVRWFLDGRIKFGAILRTVLKVVSEHTPSDVSSIEDVVAADVWARTRAEELMGTRA